MEAEAAEVAVVEVVAVEAVPICWRRASIPRVSSSVMHGLQMNDLPPDVQY